MNRFSPHYSPGEQQALMVPDQEGGWVHINSVEARAIKELEARIQQLEAVLRKLHADNAGECEQSIDPADIEAVMPELKPLLRVTVTREQMEHARDNPGEAWRKVAGEEHEVDKAREHYDRLHRRHIDTDKGWP